METQYLIYKNISVPPATEYGEWEWDTELVICSTNRKVIERKLKQLDDGNDTYFMAIENWEHLGEGFYGYVAEDHSIYAWELK